MAATIDDITLDNLLALKGEMEQKEKEVATLRAKLANAEIALKSARENFDGELGGLDPKLAMLLNGNAIRSYVVPAENESTEEGGQRLTKKLVREIVHSTGSLSIEAIKTRVQRKRPGAKLDSLEAHLAKLVEEGEIKLNGKHYMKA